MFVKCILPIVVLAGCEAATPPAAPSDGAGHGTPKLAVESVSPHPTAQNHPDQQDSLVELEAISLTAPQEWMRKPVSSDFVLTEFTLSRVAGDDWDGRLTVSVAGGDIEANVQRWRTQFGGKPASESRRQTTVEGQDVTLIDFSGDYSDQRGPFAPATSRPGTRMLAAIVPVSRELYFIKAVGPEKTMAANEKNFESFVHSVKKR
jgi:hypothetical protein